MCDDKGREKLVDDATYDISEIRSETDSEKIGRNNYSEENVSDITSDDSHSINSEYVGRDYNLRSRNNRDYSHHFENTMENPTSNQSYDVQMIQNSVLDMQGSEDTQPLFKHLVGITMIQMSAKAGIKKHEKEAATALFNVFFQLGDKMVFRGLWSSLSHNQKSRALRATNPIKEKRCGKLKDRTVAESSVQRNVYTKEETTSSTIPNDELMLKMVVYAWENRDVATTDVEGAYLHLDIDD